MTARSRATSEIGSEFVIQASIAPAWESLEIEVTDSGIRIFPYFFNTLVWFYIFFYRHSLFSTLLSHCLYLLVGIFMMLIFM